MKTKVNKIINQIEGWEVEDLERLISEIDSLVDIRFCACGAEMTDYEIEHIGVCNECR